MRLLLLLSLILSGCGRIVDTFRRLEPPGFTEVRISPRGEGPSPMAVLAGGAMVYAVNSLEPFRRGGRKIPDETSVLSWMIPTAEYIFYAVGWQAPNMSSGSQMLCGKTPGPVRLTGEPIHITINLSTANCGEAPFVPPGWNNGTQPKAISVAHCSGVGSLPGTPSTGGLCSGGSLKDYKVSLPSFDAFQGEIKVSELPGHSVESPCLTTGASGAPAASSLVFPLGAAPPGNGFVTGINTYSTGGGTCTPPKRLYGFGDGIQAFNVVNRVIYEYEGSPVSSGVPLTAVGNGASNIFIYLADF